MTHTATKRSYRVLAQTLRQKAEMRPRESERASVSEQKGRVFLHLAVAVDP